MLEAVEAADNTWDTLEGVDRIADMVALAAVKGSVGIVVTVAAGRVDRSAEAYTNSIFFSISFRILVET